MRLKTVGLGASRAAMRRRAEKLGNFRDPHRAAAVALLAWTQRNIRAEGGQHDSPQYSWPPLSPNYKAWKVKHGFSPQALFLHGDLFRNWRIVASNRRGKLTSGVDYSSTHEHGKGHVPMRKILPGEDQAREIVRPIFGRHVAVSIK